MKTIEIDFPYLIFAYQDDCQDNKYYLDTEFGDIRLVHRQLDDLRDLTDEIELSVNRFLYIPKASRQKLLADLQIFADSLENNDIKRILLVAFDSPHVLEAFKKILSSCPDLYNQLETFLYEQSKKEVLAWLKANAIAPTSLSPNS